MSSFCDVHDNNRVTVLSTAPIVVLLKQCVLCQTCPNCHMSCPDQICLSLSYLDWSLFNDNTPGSGECKIIAVTMAHCMWLTTFNYRICSSMLYMGKWFVCFFLYSEKSCLCPSVINFNVTTFSVIQSNPLIALVFSMKLSFNFLQQSILNIPYFSLLFTTDNFI